ncbi:ENTH domain protein [Dictyocaulus viviparus]|uniref:ENTH domain protein n=1 Tax=Dictyocaulus viviparus TaxID=29172 RepID=A0A0D8XNN8_DICVI|nr:ENTH domain protein [Dictyocaulus viviparus]
MANDFYLWAPLQLEAVHKALTKYEMPLKPKHARRLIVGTHQERSDLVHQLEKNPVMTWKFCHLLHKLIRDGHRKVPDESSRFIPRIKQLGQFWKHLNTSGYGVCNETYTSLLVDRLEFHKKASLICHKINAVVQTKQY